MWKLDCDNGHILHRIGNEDYPIIRHAFVKVDDVDNYEEIAVSDIPPYTKTEYDKKVAELVREKYSESEEFAIQRKAINAAFSPSPQTAANNNAMAEYSEYNAFVESCKQKAKDPELYTSEN